jgi:transcriptional regulator with XRE-family HTH domain
MDRAALRKLRKSMRLTQAQMAALIRMPVAALKKLEARNLGTRKRRNAR